MNDKKTFEFTFTDGYNNFTVKYSTSKKARAEMLFKQSLGYKIIKFVSVHNE